MKKIIYIDYLDWISLLIILISKPFFNRVGYHNANNFFSKSITRAFLSYFGIEWFSHTNLKISSWANAYFLNNSLTKLVLVKELLKNFTYLKMEKKLLLDELGKKKLSALMRKELLKNWIHEGTTSFSLIETLFNKDDFICYIPSTYDNYLLGKQYNRFTKIIGVHILMRLFLKITFKITSVFKNKIKLFFKKNKNKNKKFHLYERVFENFNFEFGYFPHNSLKYGEFFKKTYIYDNNKDSVFYKSRVLTLSFKSFDKLSERFFKFFKIPNAIFDVKSDIFEMFKCFIQSLKLLDFSKYKIFSTKHIYANLFLIAFYSRVLFYIKNLNRFPSLKFIYFHYDILVPSPFLLACHLKNIQTISTQERNISVFWSIGLTFDHYFIAGSHLKFYCEKHGYVIGKYYPIGLSRAHFISRSYIEEKYNKYLTISKTKKIVVCYDLPMENEFIVGLRHSIISKKSINYFHRAITRLAINFKECHFIIKPKMIYQYHYELSNKIKNIKNLEVITDIRKYNPYKLASLADIIVGKHTSILEEAIASEKITIIFDNDDYLSTINYILSDPCIVVKNYNQLSCLFTQLINGNFNDYLRFLIHIRKNYFMKTNGGYFSVKKELREILLGEKNYG